MSPTPQLELERKKAVAVAQARLRVKQRAGGAPGAFEQAATAIPRALSAISGAGMDAAGLSPEEQVRRREEAPRLAQEREAAERARRREMATLGAGSDVLLTEDARGNIRPGTDVDRDIGRGLVTLPLQAAEAANDTIESGVNLYGSLANTLMKPALRAAGASEAPIAVNMPDNPMIAPGGEMHSVTGDIAKSGMQFAAARVPLGMAAKSSAIIPSLAKDTLATGLAFQGNEGRVSDMLTGNLPEGTPNALRSYVDFLSTKEGDSDLVGRGKNMLEDLTLSSPLLAPFAAVAAGRGMANALNAPPARPAPQPSGPAPAAASPPVPAIARQASPPATTPQVAPGTAVSSLGEVEAWFNSLPQKAREATLRLFSSSGVTDKADQFAIIADLNSLPSGRNSQNAFLIAQKWGERYPSLRENLSNVGGGFAVTNPRPNDKKLMGVLGKGDADRAQAIMDTEGRKQVLSERGFLERSAETNFGKPSADVAKALKEELSGLSGRYNWLLDPNRRRKFGPEKTQQLSQAEAGLQEYLRQPWVVQNMPPAVRDRLLVDASQEIRDLGWSKDQIDLITAGPGGKALAPLFEATGPLPWSQEAWDTIITQYPRFAAHVLQSSYQKAARGLGSGINAADNYGTIAQLHRMRGLGEDGNAIPGGLLDRLEKTMPNADFSFTGKGSYSDTRKNWGDIKGAEEAFDLTRKFKTAAQSGEDVAEIIDGMGRLSPRAKEAALSEITAFVQDSMGAKVRNVTPGQAGMGGDTAPNLTQLGNENFLRALRKVFGQQGDALANDIELARSSTTFNTDINRRLNSRTEINTQNVRQSPALYEDPAGIEGGVIDNTVQTLGGMAGVAAFIPGGQGAALTAAGLAAARAAWNAFKSGKRLTNAERSAFADFLFRSRSANPEDIAALDAGGAPSPSPNLPSGLGYAGNVATGAAAGGVVGGVASGGDPEAIAAGAAAGAGVGGVRAAQRAARAGSSIIPQRALPPPAKPPERMGFGGSRKQPRDIVEAQDKARVLEGIEEELRAASTPEEIARLTALRDEARREFGLLDSMGRESIAPIAGGAIGSTAGTEIDPETGEYVGYDPVRGLAGAALGAGATKLAQRMGAPKVGRAPDQATFAGVNAKTADKKLLGIAQDMERAGAGRDQIWRETGWFKGVDGKWRFEIDDSAAQYRGQGPRLGATLDDASAGGAYPDLPMIQTTKAGGGTDADGGYIPPAWGSDEAIFYKGGPKRARSVLLHERQHAIQDREGFGSGAAYNYFEYKFGDRAEQAAWDAIVDEKRAIMDAVDLNDIMRREDFQRLAKKYSDDPQMQKIATSNRVSQNEMPYLERFRELEVQQKKLLGPNSSLLSPEDAYRRTSGEVEARNVEVRKDFTPDQRRRKAPWETQDIPDERQIVRPGKDVLNLGAPDSNSMFGGMGGKPIRDARNYPPRVAETVNALRKALPPPVIDAVRKNALKPESARLSTMEAAGNDPALFSLAAPFVTRPTGRGQVKGPITLPPPATRLDKRLNDAKLSAARSAPDPETERAAELYAKEEKRRQIAKGQVTRWMNKEGMIREMAGKPVKVPPQLQRRLANAEEAAALAKDLFQRTKSKEMEVGVARSAAQGVLTEIEDILMKGGQTGKPRTRREAREMARLLFDKDYADTMARALTGDIDLKGGGSDLLNLSLAAGGGLAGISAVTAWPSMMDTAARNANEKAEASGLYRKPKPQPQYTRPDWPEYRYDWERIRKSRQAMTELQSAMNRYADKSGLGRSVDVDGHDGKVTRAMIRTILWDKGMDPDIVSEDASVPVPEDVFMMIMDAGSSVVGRDLQPAQ
jgi:hypothetical protein